MSLRGLFDCRQSKEENERIRAQQECDTAWTSYHGAELTAQNARLDQQIAKLQGRPENRGKTARAEFVAEASRPSCTGHDADLIEAMELLNDGLAAISAEQAADRHAKAERAYAENRKLQTRYMSLRLWAFLTGTEPRKTPADLAFEQEQK